MPELRNSKKQKAAAILATAFMFSISCPLMQQASAGPAEAEPLPSEFDADRSLKFDENKWRKLTEQGIKALEQKHYKTAETVFQAAVREASKSPAMSTYMIDSLVHTAEVYRVTGKKQEAKEQMDQALQLVSVLVAEKCPLCESEKESIPVIYGPHSEELDEWVKSKAAQLGDFSEVTQKTRKKRPHWYCKQCEKSY